MTRTIDWALFFFQNDSRFCIRLKESNLCFRIWPNESNLFLKIFWKFFQYGSQNWTPFSALLKEWNIWEYQSKNWTSFEITHDIKNWTSCEMKFISPKELNLLFYTTQRIEFFWRKELNPFSRIGLNWTFFIWVKDLRTCFWTWLDDLSLFSTWLKELNLFWNVSQTIVFFFFERDSKN